MDLTLFKDVKISTLIEIIDTLDKPLKDAIPIMKDICTRNNFEWKDCKQLCNIAKILSKA